MTTTAVPSVLFTAERRRALRVKIKSLAAEARIIRQEEARTRQSMTAAAGRDEQVAALASAFASLRAHRTNEVRKESRHALLAYALLRGRSISSAEPIGKKGVRVGVDVPKLVTLCGRFGANPTTSWADVVARWSVGG